MHTRSKSLAALVIAVLLTNAGCRTTAEQSNFKDWPAGASPQDVGRRVAENFVARQFDYETNPEPAIRHLSRGLRLVRFVDRRAIDP